MHQSNRICWRLLVRNCQRIVLAACLRAVVMVGEFGGHLPDPGGGFAFGDAAIQWAGTAPRVCWWVWAWAWGVAESGVITRWYCLIAHWFAISGGRMMALHSDI